MAYKSLSKTKQRLSMKNTPGKLIDPDKPHEIVIKLDMPISTAIRLLNKMCIVCKACDYYKEYTADYIKDNFNVKKAFHIVYSRLIKKRKCEICDSDVTLLYYKYKKLSESEINDIRESLENHNELTNKVIVRKRT